MNAGIKEFEAASVMMNTSVSFLKGGDILLLKVVRQRTKVSH